MSLLTDQLKDENMSLEDKLAAIDLAMAEAMNNTVKVTKNNFNIATDPAENPLMVCDSCQ